MKKVVFATFVFALLALPAVAADMPVKARVVDPPATVHDWSGLYVGVHVGGDRFKKDWFYPLTPTNVIAGGPFNVPSGSPTATSWLAGGQFGFNYQTGNWVFGGEIDFSWTNLNGFAADQFFPENGFSKTDFISTFAGRVGYAFDRVLLFAKAGGAGAHDEYRTTFRPDGSPLTQASETRWGWMVGGGVEYALAKNWSVKAEYNYLDFGTKRITFASLNSVNPNGVPFDEDIKQRVHMVKLGLNYQFDWGKTVKY